MTSEMTVGARETMRMLERGLLEEVLLARDSDSFVTRPFMETAKLRQVKITFIDSKKSLGNICSIAHGAAVAGKIRRDGR